MKKYVFLFFKSVAKIMLAHTETESLDNAILEL